MRFCIHRGTREIGGTCVELEAAGFSIILDLGLPLDVSHSDTVPLPDVRGLSKRDSSLLAILLSHGHRDHWGLVPRARPEIPIVMGRAAESIMRAAADFIPDGFAPKATAYLKSGERLQLGPFSLVPHRDYMAFVAEQTKGADVREVEVMV